MMSLAHAEKKLSSGSSRYEDSDGCYLQKSRHPRKLELQQLSTSNSGSRVNRIRSSSSAANLIAKKRVIRMLIVIVVLFFLCWMPIFSANAWRAYDTASAERHLSGTPISFILLLSYTSSCVNPIIYCFMNKRFRLGFMATFPCCPNPGPPGVRGEVGEEEDGRTLGASLTRYSYSHMSTSAPPPWAMIASPLLQQEGRDQGARKKRKRRKRKLEWRRRETHFSWGLFNVCFSSFVEFHKELKVESWEWQDIFHSVHHGRNLRPGIGAPKGSCYKCHCQVHGENGGVDPDEL